MSSEGKINRSPASGQLPRVMLIPDSVNWILGTWAQEIEKWNSEHFEFVIFPVGEIWENEPLFLSLLNEIEVVHCLSQSVYPSIHKTINKANIDHLTLISTIHHIVHFEQVVECLQADKIMVVCEQFKQELISNNVPKEKLFLIYNGVDTSFYLPKDRDLARRKLGLTQDKFTIGYSAKASSDHDGRKGVDIFQAVLYELAKLELDMDVVITGPGWDKIVNSLRENGITVHYFPYLSKELMPDYYNALDVYLVTSRVEGGPVPPLEAMSCGTAIISTPIGTILDYVTDGVSGLLTPIANVEAAREAILKLYHDRQLSERLGKQGRETILQSLQWKDTVSGLGDLYNMVENKPARAISTPAGHRDLKQLSTALIQKDQIRWQERNELQSPWEKKIVSGKHENPSTIIDPVLGFIKQCQLGPDPWRFAATPGGPEILYASCFAYMLYHYLGRSDEFSPEQKQGWAAYLNSWQDPKSGYFIGPELVETELISRKHSYEHIAQHLTAHVLPTLALLGASPEYPLRFAHPFVDLAYLQDWLESRDWRDAWLEGNNLLFIGQFLIFLRDFEKDARAQQALDLYFDWLDRGVDPATGLWGTNGFCSNANALYGGYHQLLVYYYENRPVRYPNRLIDVALSLQHPDGGFNPNGGGGACEDVDAVDILVNMYKQADYKRPQIRIALRRLLRQLLDMQAPDGGFVYRRHQPFVHMGITKTASPANQSNLFPTWFRIHTLALVSEILTDESVVKMDWGFNNTCSMGWHRTWNREVHDLGWQDRTNETFIRWARRVRHGYNALPGKFATLRSRVKHLS